ncbi:hypothetical protein TTRE_0000892001 [Trichuris trichiura]|uniref:TTI1 C-terminal TPR domain-containing protein n=1 Tax=Trichuris trichiura TaxID=36087 RepID=A0A077ZLC0_TRITR|nr:hypothetical protein TTRE_0000892001 [Trichuris trichiura]
MMSTRMSKVQQGPSRSIDTSEEVASLLRFIDAIQKHGVIDDVSIALMVLDIFACFSSSSSSKTIVVKTLDSDTASGLLSSLSMIFRTMDEKLFEEMGVANLPVVAHVVHILLTWTKVYKDSKAAHIIFCLKKLLCRSPTVLGSVFPGACRAVFELLLQKEEQAQSNLVDYLCLLFEMLQSMIRFEKSKPDQWKCAAAKMLESSMYALTARHSSNVNREIRQTLGVQSALLLLNLPDAMGSCQGRLLDVVATLSYDADYSVAEAVRRATNKLYREKFQPQIAFKLLECCDRLPCASQNVFSSQQQMEYQLLCGYIALLGPEGMRQFSLCESHVEKLVNSMLECISMKLSPVSEYIVEEELLSKETCSSTPADSCVVLVVPEEPRAQELLQDALGLIGSFSNLQLLVEALLQKTLDGRLKMEALYALNKTFLGALKHRNDAASDFAEITLQAVLEEFSDANRIPLLRMLLLLETMRCCSLALRSNLLPYLLSGLYVALSLSGEYATKVAAERVLASFAVALDESSVCSLILNNMDYLVSSLLIRIRYHSLYPEVCSVLASLFKKIDLVQADKTAPLITEAMLILDQSEEDQEIVLRLWQAFLSFCQVCKVGRNVAEDESGEEPEDEKESPWYVGKLVDILKRARSWIRANSIPVQLISMKTFAVAVEALSNFQNDLLPILHQIWPSLISIFKSGAPIAKAASCRAIVAAVNNSGSFYSKRFQEEALPTVTKLLNELAGCSSNATLTYLQSPRFSLQFELLNGLADVCKCLELPKEQVTACMAACEPYVNKDQPKKLRELAESGMKKMKSLM